jgi:hypothetical protein
MADTIVDGTAFSTEIMYYSAPKANAQGGKSVNILNRDTKSGLRVAAPLMLTWGASDFVDPATGKGNGKYELSLQFPSAEYNTEDAEAFLKNMVALEEKIKADALANSKDWFGKVHKNAEVISALYTPMLKYPKNKDTGEPDLSKPPTLRVKIPIWEGVWKCEIYDEDETKLYPSSNNLSTPVEFLQKGINVATLIQCGGIWFANGKFGVTWKLIQAVVQRPRASLTGSCFIKLKPSDKAKLKSATAPVADVCDDDDMVATAEVEDSDEEDDPAPTPVPVVAAPVVAAPVVAAPVAAAPAAATEEPKKKKVVKKLKE